MAESLHTLDSTNHFDDGCFENITLGGSGLVLERDGDAYLQRGCFTSGEIKTCAFTALIATWNCDTPANTCTELEISIKRGDEWSGYCSFGLWSPFILRGGKDAAPADDGILFDNDTLCTSKPAQAFRIRMNLFSSDGILTPCVRRITVSVLPVSSEKSDGAPLNRVVHVPEYSQLLRAPDMAHEAALPVTVAMLLNRIGEDILPEELAHCCFDSAMQIYTNRSFAMAAAGSLGYKACCRYTDIDGLKKEIKAGFACGVSVRCGGLDSGDTYIDSLIGPIPRHTVAVCGFETNAEGQQYVIINNPYAFTDEGAHKRCTLEEFKRSWTGLALIVHEKETPDTLCPPRRVCAQLSPAELPGEWALYVQGERRSISSDINLTGTVCYALREQRAFATTAHRRFYYTSVSESGNIILDTEMLPAGTKFTLFIITGTGTIYVAEGKI